MADLIATSFSTGAVSIGDTIQAHDFVKGPLVCALAPAFGRLSKESIFDLDDEVKIMVVGSLRALSRVPVKDKSWDSAMRTMRQDVSVVQQCNKLFARQDVLGPQYLKCFKSSARGGTDAADVEEVSSWLQGFTCGKRNLDNMEIVGDVLANMILEVGAALGERERGSKYYWVSGNDSKALLDIGVLQFPDSENPHQIHLFRLRLSTVGSRGIVGECTLQMFEPDCLAINNTSPADRKDAIDTANAIFDSP